jgi:hypothetical protein
MKKRPRAYQQNTALSFEGVLDRILGECDRVEQWAAMKCFDSAQPHFVAALTLIELLEVHLTGSSGSSYGGWGMEAFSRCNDDEYLAGQSDLRGRLSILIKELKFRKLIPANFSPSDE